MGLFDLGYHYSVDPDNKTLFYLGIFFLLYGSLSMLVISFAVKRRERLMAEREESYEVFDLPDMSGMSVEEKLSELDARHRDGKISDELYEAIKRSLDDEGK